MISLAAKDFVVSQKYSKILDTIQEAIFVLKGQKLEFVNKIGRDLLNAISQEFQMSTSEDQSQLLLEETCFFVY